MFWNFSGQFSRAKPFLSQISDQNEVRWLIVVRPKLQDRKFTQKTGDSTIFQPEFWVENLRIYTLEIGRVV